MDLGERVDGEGLGGVERGGCVQDVLYERRINKTKKRNHTNKRLTLAAPPSVSLTTHTAIKSSFSGNGGVSSEINKHGPIANYRHGGEAGRKEDAS